MRRLALAALFLLVATSAVAQRAPSLLVIEQERLLTDSLPGRALLEAQERQAEALNQEARQLDRQFEAEERRLTELRDTVSAEEFRALADAFDAKVIATRREQEQKSTALARSIEAERRAFYRTVEPILQAILRETGASAAIDMRAVFLANQDLNITGEVIKRLNDAHRAGPTPAPDAQ